MKSHTDLEQSKKLAEFLPLESADMFLALNGTLPVMSKYIDNGLVTADDTVIPCWSLVALLNILDFPALTQEDENEWEVCVRDYNNDEYIEIKADNPIDACVDMILLCKEHNLL